MILMKNLVSKNNFRIGSENLNIKQILEKTKLPKENIKYNEQMSSYTTFKIGGPAEVLIKIETVEQLQEVLNLAKTESIPLTIIGNGSNLLVKDKGIKGIVLKIGIKTLEIKKENQDITIKVGSGIKLGWLAQKMLKEEITGLEFASGIPGTIGGAVRMNAGAYGSEMKDIISKITYIDKLGKINTIENKQAEFSYRNSIFKNNKNIITEVEIKLQQGKKTEIQKKMLEYSNSRKEKQPIEYASAGSTFKRGENFITAQLIDECGIKGYQIGGAQISEKHAGFIINKGNATAKDVVELIEYTKEQVYKKFGKKIETEIEIIGEEENEGNTTLAKI